MPARRSASIASIPVAISARHVHLTQPTVERLFGAGHQLREHAPLTQPGQFAAVEKVTLAGPHGRIAEVRVVGPTRSENQVEVSRTDELRLGVDAPVRLSGQLSRTPGITLIGPAGSVHLDRGVITASRHIHMTPADARRLGVHDREKVSVAIDSDGRDLIFGDVIVRVAPDFRLELHLDTDEGNAAGLHPGDTGQLLTPTALRARVHTPGRG
ncbi:MAG TPA: phosphate propanoyltransferase [Steroidobacteraceae bacterium]|nr:phosphate propanoyltransferase [Steroidobacteraceae bacterium]